MAGIGNLAIPGAAMTNVTSSLTTDTTYLLEVASSDPPIELFDIEAADATAAAAIAEQIKGGTHASITDGVFIYPTSSMGIGGRAYKAQAGHFLFARTSRRGSRLVYTGA